MTLAPHQQRVFDEKTELDAKLHKLETFMEENELFHKLDDAERNRMVRQRQHMREYSEVLAERIEAFPTPPEL